MIQELIRFTRVRDSLNKLCVKYFTTEILEEIHQACEVNKSI